MARLLLHISCVLAGHGASIPKLSHQLLLQLLDLAFILDIFLLTGLLFSEKLLLARVDLNLRILKLFEYFNVLLLY